MDNTYEVTTELQNYDDQKGFLPAQSLQEGKIQQQSAAYILGRFGMCLSLVMTLILLLTFFALGIILGVTAVTLNQVNNLNNNLPSCNTSTTVAGAAITGEGTVNISCNGGGYGLTVINKTDELQEQVRVNDANMRNEIQLMQSKMDEILNKTTTCASNDIEQKNITETLLRMTEDSAQKLINIVNTLANIQDTGTSTAGVANDILLVVEELLVLHNDSTLIPSSCADVKKQNPNSPSGFYLTIPANGGSAVYTYCYMDTLCGSGGGWTRLAYLDMSDATQSCPSGFRLYQSGGVRACGRPSNNSPGCLSVQFPSHGTSYSQVCGRVVGYQYGSPDAVSINNTPGHNNINSYYVDGVSITRGSPRQHVWTFMAGFSDTASSGNNCPCTNPPGNLQQVQSFVGTNYFCESGNPSNSWTQSIYTSDPLWDGQGCGSNEGTCCAAPGLPWFHRDYGSATTTDYLELRICDDEGTNNEDIPVGYYEIYVK